MSLSRFSLLTLSQLKPEDPLSSLRTYHSIYRNDRGAERQPQLCLSWLQGLSRTIRSITPSSLAIRAWVSFSHTTAHFYEDAQEQSVFQVNLISSGSKHHITISQLQLHYEK